MSKRMTQTSPKSIDPLALSRLIGDRYNNQSLASVNDHEVRMSVMTEQFPWHHHPDSDETFFGVDGQLVSEFADGEVTLSPGQCVTVPAGVRHRAWKLVNYNQQTGATFERTGASTVFDE